MRARAVFIVLLAFIMLAGGCMAFTPPGESIDEGMAGYMEGKRTVTPSPGNDGGTAAALEQMIANYSGGMYDPVYGGNTELDDVPDPAPEPTQTPLQTPTAGETAAPTAAPSTPLDRARAMLLQFMGSGDTLSTDKVASDAELTALLSEAVIETHEEVAFYCVDGYAPAREHVIHDILFTDIEENLLLAYMFIDGASTAVGTSPSGDMYYRITINYYGGHSRGEMISIKEESLRTLVDVALSLDLYSMGEAERIGAINEYLCDNVEYHPGDSPYPAQAHTVYGALELGQAVCDGYSRAAACLYEISGGRCIIELGECGGPDSRHAWNLVRVDGQWYQLDVTWNDGGDTSEYFLVTDEYMRQSRTWDEGRYPSTPVTPYAQ